MRVPEAATWRLIRSHPPLSRVATRCLCSRQQRRGERRAGDGSGLEETQSRAAGDADRALVVDLSDCAFVDSVGLATLLQGAKPLQNGEANVAFVAPDGPVRKLLTLTAVDRTIPVFATVAEARAAVLDPG